MHFFSFLLCQTHSSNSRYSLISVNFLQTFFFFWLMNFLQLRVQLGRNLTLACMLDWGFNFKEHLKQQIVISNLFKLIVLDYSLILTHQDVLLFRIEFWFCSFILPLSLSKVADSVGCIISSLFTLTSLTWASFHFDKLFWYSK